MTMGLRRPLHRVACIVLAAAMAAGGVALNAMRTQALPAFACAHFHAVWSYTPQGYFGMTNPITVSASTCTGASTGVSNTSGSGSVTLEQASGLLLGTAWVNHYDLSLVAGDMAVHPVFDATMVPYALPLGEPGVPDLSGTFDYGLTGTVAFEGVTGTGVMNERCTYSRALLLITCTDDGSFAYEA